MAIYFDAKLNKTIKGNPPPCIRCGDDQATFYDDTGTCFKYTAQLDQKIKEEI